MYELSGQVYVPSNDYGIESRYYTVNELVDLLRESSSNSQIVYFIADMMEL